MHTVSTVTWSYRCCTTIVSLQASTVSLQWWNLLIMDALVLVQLFRGHTCIVLIAYLTTKVSHPWRPFLLCLLFGMSLSEAHCTTCYYYHRYSLTHNVSVYYHGSPSTHKSQITTTHPLNHVSLTKQQQCTTLPLHTTQSSLYTWASDRHIYQFVHREHVVPTSTLSRQSIEGLTYRNRLLSWKWNWNESCLPDTLRYVVSIAWRVSRLVSGQWVPQSTLSRWVSEWVSEWVVSEWACEWVGGWWVSDWVSRW